MSAVILLVVAAAAVIAIMRFGGQAAQRAGLFPVSAIVLGGLLTVTGRLKFGLPMILLGIGMWYARQGRSPAGTSEVRTEWLVMRLDHESDAMDGDILRGMFEGRTLESLSNGELSSFAGEVAHDADRKTIELVEAYLDRRTPGWRDGTDGDEASGLGGTPGSGPMGEKEAYEVLGLAPGASEAEIREAHRRLMKRAHPDAGGSAGSAARLNEAKDILLRAHSR